MAESVAVRMMISRALHLHLPSSSQDSATRKKGPGKSIALIRSRVRAPRRHFRAELLNTFVKEWRSNILPRRTP